jgi:hypothetical protein
MVVSTDGPLVWWHENGFSMFGFKTARRPSRDLPALG